MICYSAVCQREDVRPYANGRFCPEHTPARMAGRKEVWVDPELTAEALREKHGLKFSFIANDTSLNDERAIASGRRRANTKQYHAAKAAEEARKQARHARSGEK